MLTGYPAADQSQILDYVSKPGYRANQQLLKLEIGGDANSTDGSEPIEHARGTVNCNAGYEFWPAGQAKARVPNIGLYGLAWAAPGWISGGFWSTDTINYSISWLGCAKQHGLTLSCLGGWNECSHDANRYVQLGSALDSADYSGVELVADDSGWGVTDAMASDSAFNNAVSIIGAHYSCDGGDGGDARTCSCTTAAKNNGKPLWGSENGPQDLNTDAPAAIRAITRGYIDAKMASYFTRRPELDELHRQLGRLPARRRYHRTAGPGSAINTGKCLDDYTGSPTAGAVVDVWDCNGSGAQQWTVSNGSVKANGLCLDVVGNATANGSLVDLWTCNGAGNQQGTVNNDTLVNPASGRCLDVPGCNTTNGSHLDIGDCNNGTNQKWNLPTE
ncbi:ricin-type beta-trefoil lectin domain protein [Streptomyces longwoodensis]|uniref:ricin-type beta-trefoil lectin domain protein n=1 Tax=Streptomyces longwoodensis TaxID=68231 RepID=UPI0033FE069A